MVALQILVLSVWVQIPVPELNDIRSGCDTYGISAVFVSVEKPLVPTEVPILSHAAHTASAVASASWLSCRMSCFSTIGITRRTREEPDMAIQS